MSTETYVAFLRFNILNFVREFRPLRHAGSAILEEGHSLLYLWEAVNAMGRRRRLLRAFDVPEVCKKLLAKYDKVWGQKGQQKR